MTTAIVVLLSCVVILNAVLLVLMWRCTKVYGKLQESMRTKISHKSEEPFFTGFEERESEREKSAVDVLSSKILEREKKKSADLRHYVDGIAIDHGLGDEMVTVDVERREDGVTAKHVLQGIRTASTYIKGKP